MELFSFTDSTVAIPIVPMQWRLIQFSFPQSQSKRLIKKISVYSYGVDSVTSDRFQLYTFGQFFGLGSAPITDAVQNIVNTQNTLFINFSTEQPFVGPYLLNDIISAGQFAISYTFAIPNGFPAIPATIDGRVEFQIQTEFVQESKPEIQFNEGRQQSRDQSPPFFI